MPTKTVTGNPITIYDAVAGQPVSLIANIEYTQSGSDTPSPTNIRPISGFDSVNITRTGVNGANPQSVAVSFASVGTVYGGNLNLTTGLLTVTHHAIIFTGTENIIKDAANSVRGSFSANNWLAPYVPNEWSTDNLSEICSNMYISGTQAQATNTNGYFGVSKWSDLWMYFHMNNADANQFKSNLASLYNAGTPLQVIYQLSAPVTYQLTPTQITTLLGYNQITSDAKTLTIEYNTKSFNVDIPQLFTVSPSNPYAGDTVTLTYSGDIELETIVAVGIDTMTNVPLTKTGNKTWKFTMPTEDVGVTVGYKPYAEIELNQTTGGVVSANKLIAYEGDVVTLTLTPAENYEPQNVKVTKDARDVKTTKVNDTTYTFVVHIQ